MWAGWPYFRPDEPMRVRGGDCSPSLCAPQPSNSGQFPPHGDPRYAAAVGSGCVTGAARAGRRQPSTGRVVRTLPQASVPWARHHTGGPLRPLCRTSWARRPPTPTRTAFRHRGPADPRRAARRARPARPRGPHRLQRPVRCCPLRPRPGGGTAEVRRTVAFASRPEVQADIAASLDGTAPDRMRARRWARRSQAPFWRVR